ncbi:MAG TPA: sulfurtransferase TusA family protein [Candidatus Mediterraneibacter stercoravium]|uniref:Sulfurtransferase TusA family protein n=1 Tax=Candidatus Mediterraneibacter stercoravium TaxID=2838685 RepID=A0A9D2K1Z7_9FIRM|nr:sulfurtransferase TusA family protein [Candidatus Mediterraneibacter stercoravium]
MREVDARGLSCPEPLMLTAEALKSGKGPVRILVTEPHQKMNVEKFARDHGRKAVSTETDDGFAVVIE